MTSLRTLNAAAGRAIPSTTTTRRRRRRWNDDEKEFSMRRGRGTTLTAAAAMKSSSSSFLSAAWSGKSALFTHNKQNNNNNTLVTTTTTTTRGRRSRMLSVVVASSSSSSGKNGVVMSSSSSSSEKKGGWFERMQAAELSTNAGRFLLGLVALSYGGLCVSLKMVFVRAGPPSVGTLGMIRGLMVLLCFVPQLLDSFKKNRSGEEKLNKDFWSAALELATWNFLAQGCCNVALLFTEATRVSFLTQASIAFTPFIETFFGEKVKKLVWAGCLVALVGVVTLGMDPGGGQSVELVGSVMPKGLSINIGDLIALVGALTYSLYVFRIGAFTKLGLDGSQLQAWKSFFLAFMYSAWGFSDFALHKVGMTTTTPFSGWRDPIIWLLIAFSAVIGGYLADVVQAKGQESVSASETQVILSGEPLFAALLGGLFLGEVLGPLGYVGGGLLLSGGLMCSFAEGSGAEKKED
jgi:drug/metabolite transporter (DMT)-like permease